MELIVDRTAVEWEWLHALKALVLVILVDLPPKKSLWGGWRAHK